MRKDNMQSTIFKWEKGLLATLLILLLGACKEEQNDPALTIPVPTIRLTAGDAASRAVGFKIHTSNASEVRWLCVEREEEMTLERLLSEGIEAETNREDEIFAEGLNFLTDYTIYAVACNGRHQKEATPLEVSTLDLPEPTLSLALLSLGTSSLKAEITSTQSTKICWACVPRESEMNREQLWESGRSLDGNNRHEVAVNGLTPLSDYTLYAIAKNERHESAIHSLEFTTLSEEVSPEQPDEDPEEGYDPGEGPGYIDKEEKPEVGPLRR